MSWFWPQGPRSYSSFSLFAAKVFLLVDFESLIIFLYFIISLSLLAWVSSVSAGLPCLVSPHVFHWDSWHQMGWSSTDQPWLIPHRFLASVDWVALWSGYLQCFSTSKRSSSHSLGFLSRAQFPYSESLNISIICNLDRLWISQIIKYWFPFA